MSMSRKSLWLLGILMGIVMLGLIFVQAYWINNAIQLKEKQFSQQVLRSMQMVSHDIESREAAVFVFEDIFAPELKDSFSEFRFDMNFDTRTGIWNQKQEQSFRFDQKIVISPGHKAPRSESIHMSVVNDSVMMVVQRPGGTDTIWVKERSDVIRIPEPEELEKKIISKKKQVDRVMSQMLRPRLPVEDRLDEALLQESLSNAFKNSGIDLPYEYAVIKQNTDLAIKSKAYNPEKNSLVFTTQLFPQDIFSSPSFLRVYFPGQKNFIFQSVGIMGIASILMTSIIIFIFILTLWVIFRQKRLSEMKSDFVNNMTHELKTPISTISLASQMLSDESIPVEKKNISHISRIIDTESKRLGYQVEKVLQMALFDKGKIRLKQKQLNVVSIAETVVDNFRLQVEKRGGQIEFSAEEGSAMVFADEVHLTNVLSNLLDNALKYSVNEPQIKVNIRNEKGFLVLSVEDKGIGISRENQKRVFEKFFRVPTGNVHNVKGFGLGLSYVKTIIEAQGGEVRLHSELHKGSRFDIYLPILKA